MKKCLGCDDPVERHPSALYCSPECRQWTKNQKMHARRDFAYRLLKHMEKNCPSALAKVAATMDR